MDWIDPIVGNWLAVLIRLKFRRRFVILSYYLVFREIGTVDRNIAFVVQSVVQMVFFLPYHRKLAESVNFR
jgi:hypothetical protein